MSSHTASSQLRRKWISTEFERKIFLTLNFTSYSANNKQFKSPSTFIWWNLQVNLHVSTLFKNFCFRKVSHFENIASIEMAAKPMSFSCNATNRCSFMSQNLYVAWRKVFASNNDATLKCLCFRTLAQWSSTCDPDDIINEDFIGDTRANSTHWIYCYLLQMLCTCAVKAKMSKKVSFLTRNIYINMAWDFTSLMFSDWCHLWYRALPHLSSATTTNYCFTMGPVSSEPMNISTYMLWYSCSICGCITAG